MAKKSMAKILKDDDYEEAATRYINCGDQSPWKAKWWDLVCTLWETAKDFAKTYIIDFAKKTLKRIQSSIEKLKNSNYCYWIRMFDEQGEHIFDKIGTSKNPTERWQKLLREKTYVEAGVIDYDVMNCWDCGENAPEGLESYLRAMCIKTIGSEHYIRNDRFDCNLNDENMNKWANEYLGVA